MGGCEAGGDGGDAAAAPRAAVAAPPVAAAVAAPTVAVGRPALTVVAPALRVVITARPLDVHLAILLDDEVLGVKVVLNCRIGLHNVASLAFDGEPDCGSGLHHKRKVMERK